MEIIFKYWLESLRGIFALLCFELVLLRCVGVLLLFLVRVLFCQGILGLKRIDGLPFANCMRDLPRVLFLNFL